MFGKRAAGPDLQEPPSPRPRQTAPPACARQTPCRSPPRAAAGAAERRPQPGPPSRRPGAGRAEGGPAPRRPRFEAAAAPRPAGQRPRSSASRATTTTPTKTTIFNALINTIDLAQLAQLDAKARGRGNPRHRRRAGGDQERLDVGGRAGAPGPGHHQRRAGLRPAGAAAGARRHRRHHGQRRRPGVHRSRRQDAADQRPFPRQHPADEHLPADRQPGRPPRRRNPRRSATPACPTARASTSSRRPWRSMVRP